MTTVCDEPGQKPLVHHIRSPWTSTDPAHIPGFSWGLENGYNLQHRWAAFGSSESASFYYNNLVNPISSFLHNLFKPVKFPPEVNEWLFFHYPCRQWVPNTNNALRQNDFPSHPMYSLFKKLNLSPWFYLPYLSNNLPAFPEQSALYRFNFMLLYFRLVLMNPGIPSILQMIFLIQDPFVLHIHQSLSLYCLFSLFLPKYLKVYQMLITFGLQSFVERLNNMYESFTSLGDKKEVKDL